MCTADILASIRDSRIALKTKMHSVAMDINRLLLDIRKVTNRVTDNEDEVTTLQQQH